MQILDTSDIDNWPSETVLGYSIIQQDFSPEILTENELQEWQAFTNEARKNEYLTARKLFRFILEKEEMESAFDLEKEPLGKPYAENGSVRLFVSFSHSREYVMCAVSGKFDIGLDIEWSRRVVNERLVKRILSEQEWKVHGEEDPIKLWTMKEAAVKSLGTGLRTNLKELELVKIDHNHFSIKINDEKSFQICSFAALDHQISLAY